MQHGRFVLVGRVKRPHGVHGEVAVEVVSDAPERFLPGAELSLLAEHSVRRTVEISSSRAHHGQLLVQFVGIEDRDQAAELRGAALEIERSRVPPPPAGSYYYYQLVGCRCRDVEAGVIGRVTEVIEDGGGLLLEVSDDERTTLVPFAADYVKKIDIDRQIIELELPPGLLELCVSPS
jgi:16S rRNA processing protein RimM